MMKILLDADASIKLTKIGIIEIVDNFGGKGSYSNNQCDIFKCKRCHRK